jgi:ParB family chromosome partitioning protein
MSALQNEINARVDGLSGSETFKVGQPTRHVNALRPHPENPRGPIDKTEPAIIELRDSIIAKGILQPLVVTSDNLILAGHRRRVASRMAYDETADEKYLSVPVTIRDLKPNEDAQELMLHENMQRRSLSLLEEARAFFGIMDRHRLSVMDLARRLSVPTPTVSGRLQILKLEPEVQAMFEADLLPITAAGSLARVEDKAKQLKLANMVARKQLTSPALKDLVAKECGGKQSESISSPAVQDRIQRSLSHQPARRPARGKSEPPAGRQMEPTRMEAVAALDRSSTKSIKLFNIKLLTETVCTACGMLENPDVCRTCPLPRLIMGIVGRSI